jgi:hypothetical protein
MANKYMGEVDKIVIINDCLAYLIREGHHNSNSEAIKIAIEIHTKKTKKEIEYYKLYKIEDKNGIPIWESINTTITSCKVFDLEDK